MLAVISTKAFELYLVLIYVWVCLDCVILKFNTSKASVLNFHMSVWIHGYTAKVRKDYLCP